MFREKTNKELEELVAVDAVIRDSGYTFEKRRITLKCKNVMH